MLCLSHRHRLLEIVVCALYLVAKDIAKRQMASNDVKKLAEIGVLQEKAAGNEKLFLNPPLLRLMTGDSNELQPYQ